MPPKQYRLLDLGPSPAAGPLADEKLLDEARTGPIACLWRADQGLVVPRTYAARPGFSAAQTDFSRQGWPIHVRQSGGGVVPQGPGIINLSLAQPFSGRPLDHADAFYQHLCGLIAASLLFFGIEARAQAVEGSFCDGRYNLAVGQPARKIAGTAQWWRRTPPSQDHPAAPQGNHPTRHIGLVHALILVQCDINQATRQANMLESALDNPRRYRSSSAVSLDQCLNPPDRADFIHQLWLRLENEILRCPAL